MADNVLLIDASLRMQGSFSRQLTAQVVAALGAKQVVQRDLISALPLIDADWNTANNTQISERSDAQRQMLRLSDLLVAELQAADTIVLGLPVYNFSVPTGFRAWVDLIARVDVTFEMLPAGLNGLLRDKRVIAVLVSGGTKIGSDMDFASGYLRAVFGFLGLDDVQFVVAEGVMQDEAAALQQANAQIAAL